jgi:D-ribose pyranase
MLKTGILNPHINSLLARVRHTNTIVLADRGFPFWPQVETIDISLVDNVPTIPDLLRAIQQNFVIGNIWMAEEFRHHNTSQTHADIVLLTHPTPITWEPHDTFKLRVPAAIGLIRTGDTTQYANMILQSA